MAASFRATLPPDKAAEQIEILRLLTDAPAQRRVLASVRDDGSVDDEFASLWPPRTAAEAEADHQRRVRRVAASRPEDDDLYRAIFGESP